MIKNTINMIVIVNNEKYTHVEIAGYQTYARKQLVKSWGSSVLVVTF